MTTAQQNRRLLTHNRVFEEYQPREPTMLQRVVRFLDSYRHVNFREVGVFRWLPTYTRSKFIGDLTAAAIIAVVLVPQGMAYAMLAGLDPVYGLYSSTVPLIVYSFITTSSQVAPGPVAPTAILMQGMVMEISGAQPRTPEFTRWHITLAFVTGLFQLILGLLRFGWVADLLSWPVMSGFASGAAFIILISQVGDLLGLRAVPRESSFFMRFYRVCEALPSANLPTILIGIVCILVLQYAKQVSWRGFKLPKMFPVPLALMVLATVVSWAVGLSSYGVKIVGRIPSDLPEPSLPIRGGMMDVQRVAVSAALLAVLNYVQTVSLAVIFGKKVGETVHSTAEMFALGGSSVVGSFFSCYTVAGSFTRTVIQYEAGAQTPATITFSGLLILVFIVTVTRILTHLPTSVLAAIVVVAARQLIGWKDAKELWHAKRSDFLQLAVTFLAVLVLDIMYGLLVGVAFALGMVLYRCFSPRIAELGRLPGTDVFVALDRFPVSHAVPGVWVLRLDGELHFGNVRVVTDKLYELLEGAKRAVVRRTAGVADGHGHGHEPLSPHDTHTPNSPTVDGVAGGDAIGGGAGYVASTDGVALHPLELDNDSNSSGASPIAGVDGVDQHHGHSHSHGHGHGHGHSHGAATREQWRATQAGTLEDWPSSRATSPVDTGSSTGASAIDVRPGSAATAGTGTAAQGESRGGALSGLTLAGPFFSGLLNGVKARASPAAAGAGVGAGAAAPASGSGSASVGPAAHSSIGRSSALNSTGRTATERRGGARLVYALSVATEDPKAHVRQRRQAAVAAHSANSRSGLVHTTVLGPECETCGTPRAAAAAAAAVGPGPGPAANGGIYNSSSGGAGATAVAIAPPSGASEGTGDFTVHSDGHGHAAGHGSGHGHGHTAGPSDIYVMRLETASAAAAAALATEVQVGSAAAAVPGTLNGASGSHGGHSGHSGVGSSGSGAVALSVHDQGHPAKQAAHQHGAPVHGFGASPAAAASAAVSSLGTLPRDGEFQGSGSFGGAGGAGTAGIAGAAGHDGLGPAGPGSAIPRTTSTGSALGSSAAGQASIQVLTAYEAATGASGSAPSVLSIEQEYHSQNRCGACGSYPFSTGAPLRAVVLDGSRVVDIDATACRELQQVMEAYAKAAIEPRVTLLFAALPGPVRDTLDAFGVHRSVDPATTRFLSIPAAIASIHERDEEADDLWDEITRDVGSFGDVAATETPLPQAQTQGQGQGQGQAVDRFQVAQDAGRELDLSLASQAIGQTDDADPTAQSR